MKGIILHGGRGTRLRPLTHTGPKQLIPIANKPTSQYALEDLRDAGITDIAIILGDVAPEKVIEYYGNGGKFGVKLTYLEQGAPRGIAHAVGLCEGFVGGEDFVVYLGDNILKGGINGFVKDFTGSDYYAMVLLTRVDNPQQFGVARFEGDRLVGLIEKPKTPPSEYALVGIYFFRSGIFEMIRELKPSWRGEIEITEAIQRVMDSGREVGYRKVSGWWKDTGRPEDILEANQLVLSELEPLNRGRVEEGAMVSGRVRIGSGSTVRREATVRGPVIIGENCDIGPNTFVGPFTSIGDNVVIQGAEIENTIIVGDSVIDCNRRIVDSLIGRSSRIVSADKNLPKGCKLIIGEGTTVSI
ncbi:MAG: glucose-1-phosphate thymidylyltransferase [Candidatus Bathyarchaeia archaeon]